MTKEKFIEYLKVLQAANPDHTFCKDGNCPLAQYYKDILGKKMLINLTSTYSPDNPNETNKPNPEWMVVFITKIDEIDLALWPFHRPSWEKITTKQCLEALK